MSLGTVTRLSITPVKGLRMQHPDSITLSPGGVVGDRMFYLVDDRGHLQSCTHNAGLLALSASFDPLRRFLQVRDDDSVRHEGIVAQGEPATTNLHGLRDIPATVVADPDWHAFFSEVIGKPVRLLEAQGAAFDVHPATLVSAGSLGALAQYAGEPSVDARRFRMHIEFGTKPDAVGQNGAGQNGAGHVEDTWQGHDVQIGEAVLRVGGAVKRCAATTRNPESGAVDWQTLRMIKGYRGLQETELGAGIAFGVYADVVASGVVTLGDEVRPVSQSGTPMTGLP